MKMKKIVKQSSGIALITLIIAIIIIIIIASIVIGTLTGDNGLLNLSTQAEGNIESTISDSQSKINDIREKIENSVGNNSGSVVSGWEITDFSTLTPIPSRGSFMVGETVSFSITITNTGNTPLYNIRVESGSGFSEVIPELQVGKAEEFHWNYIISAQDTINGSHTEEVTVSDEEKVETVSLAVPVYKPVKNWEIIDFSTASEPINASGYTLGETIVFNMTIKNTGDTAIEDLIVESTSGFSDFATIPAGGEALIEWNYVVTEQDVINGSITEEVTVSDEENMETVSLTVPVEHPSCEIIDFSTALANHVYDLGETISYSLTIKNTGNVDIENLIAVSELLGLYEEVQIPVGEEVIIEDIIYVVTEGDVLEGNVIADVTIFIDEVEEDTASLTVPVAKPEASCEIIDISTLSEPANGSCYDLGETILYSITIKNTGNTVMENLTFVSEICAYEEPVTRTTSRRRSKN